MDTFISIIQALNVSSDSILDFIEKFDKVEIETETDLAILKYILKLPDKTKKVIAEILKN